jgi:hypothetical protein
MLALLFLEENLQNKNFGKGSIQKNNYIFAASMKQSLIYIIII